MRKIIFSLLLIALPIICVSSSDEEVKKPLQIDWNFEGALGYFDIQSIQRGFKVYKEVCSACHSIKRIAFRNLLEIGFSEAEVKAIASDYLVVDGPNDSGEMYERPASLVDFFPLVYPNDESAAAANNGAIPPDLSLIVKARHDGPNYVYSLLSGYTSAIQNEDGLYENPYYPSGSFGMAPPLSNDLISYDDDTEASIENMSRDVVYFLQWAAEPEMEKRKKLGLKILTFLGISTLIMIVVKKRVWKELDDDE